jgi:hypothetical protein
MSAFLKVVFWHEFKNHLRQRQITQRDGAQQDTDSARLQVVLALIFHDLGQAP